jgi:hypothetical protein
MRDHRQVGYGSQDVDSYVAAAMTVNDVAASAMQYRELSHVEPHGMAVRLRTIATDTTGNPFEWEMAAMFTVAHGLITLAEGFEAADYDVAKARLEELRPPGPPYLASLNNAATLGIYESTAAIERGEYDALTTATENFHYEDHRKGLGTDFEGPDSLNELWQSATGATFEVEPIAVRGDRLALLRVTLHALESGYVGTGLVINEVNPDGLSIATIMFDLDDLDAAVIELDRRYSAGEGATS